MLEGLVRAATARWRRRPPQTNFRIIFFFFFQEYNSTRIVPGCSTRNGLRVRVCKTDTGKRFGFLKKHGLRDWAKRLVRLTRQQLKWVTLWKESNNMNLWTHPLTPYSPNLVSNSLIEATLTRDPVTLCWFTLAVPVQAGPGRTEPPRHRLPASRSGTLHCDGQAPAGTHSQDALTREEAVRHPSVQAREQALHGAIKERKTEPGKPTSADLKKDILFYFVQTGYLATKERKTEPGKRTLTQREMF